MELEPPPPVEEGSPAAQATEDTSPPEPVQGPVLLAGTRDGPRATLTLVGEIVGDALSPFPDTTVREATHLAELTAPGREWILFSDGVRVGRLWSEASDSAQPFCGERVSVSGTVELVPEAADAERLLALPRAVGVERPYEPYRPSDHDYDQRVATLTLASEAIPRLGAPWPDGGVLESRVEVRAFRLGGAAGTSVAATFLRRDRLDVSSPGQGAYALFVMGTELGSGYEGEFEWFRSVEAEGKGAPRYFDHLDFDGDGTDEILLDVFGSNRRWFASLAHRGGSWVRSFQDACGTSGASSGG